MTNLDEIRNKISLVALAEEAGAHFQYAHRLSSHCPLPRHTGDRSNPSAFHVYDNGQKWKCFTSCPSGANGGDVFSFYMAWKDVDFKTALAELAERAALPVTTISSAYTPPPPKPIPTGPAENWRNRAEQFITWAEETLAGPEGTNARMYLEQTRGLWPETWQTFRLGYNPENLYDRPGKWGLSGKKIWLPRGIVIPGWWKGFPWYIKIRRPMVDDTLAQHIGAWTASDGLEGFKFGGPRGGQAVLFGQDQANRMPVLLLVEGEWDAMLTWQWCRDLCDVGTLGGAQSHLDALDLAVLTRYAAILVVHDDDQAGEKGRQYVAKIRQSSGRVQIVQPPPAHDLTDFWKTGGNLRGWVAEYVADGLEIALLQIPNPMSDTTQRWKRHAFWARQQAD
jgi:DNA primase